MDVAVLAGATVVEVVLHTHGAAVGDTDKSALGSLPLEVSFASVRGSGAGGEVVLKVLSRPSTDNASGPRVATSRRGALVASRRALRVAKLPSE
ncbi:hypothetical protein A4X03_0g7825 [Tilletia caries]|uniref:Uncharacterized protein n=1 Tax=Tilletia caries TaxID=13290 RepID=A0A8T8SLF0_9BASI|nr:hypothetical protein A4X03_0g7825 [Tilletia caries]